MNRNEKVLASVDRSMRVMELGPLDRPIAPKSDGWLTSVVDHATREDLVEKYRSDPNVDTSRIEEVDIVWAAGRLDEVLPGESRGTYDAFIASHVIEHVPNPLGLLQSLERVLRPTGVISLVVPDKRFCFDFFKPLSSVGELLDAHARGAVRHSRKTRFDYEAYGITADGEIAFSKRQVRDIDFLVPLEVAKQSFDAHGAEEDAPHVDLHGWHFTPSSFELAMLELSALEMIDFSIDRTFPPEGCEFYVTLRRGRVDYGTERDLRDQRLELLRRTFAEVGEQIEMLADVAAPREPPAADGGETIDALRKERDCALRNYEMAMNSKSMRVTAPLRRVAALLRR
jgi:SAM-dependent methyltransferase